MSDKQPGIVSEPGRGLTSRIRSIAGNGRVDLIKRTIKRGKALSKGTWISPNRMQLNPDISEQISTLTLRTPKRHTFFGYYDRSPFNLANSKCLAGTISNKVQTSGKEPLQIGYFNLRGQSQDFQPIAETRSWSWQQGCMMQWDPSNPDCIIFNSSTTYGTETIRLNIKTKRQQKLVDRPFYSISGRGELALSCNFDRLAKLRPGYGFALDDTRIVDSAPANDGVWLLDLHTGKSELLIPLSKLALHDPQESMQDAIHYVHHFQFNPSSTRFLMIHLWMRNGKHHSRLLTSDLSGEVLTVSNNYISHYCWKDDYRITAFSYHESDGLQYYTFDQLGSPPALVNCGNNIVDGHCTYIGNSSTMLTDTYPDEYGIQTLKISHNHNSECTWIAKYYSSTRYYDAHRCDLHPRSSRDGKLIAVDVGDKKGRSIDIIQLSDELLTKLLSD